MINKFELDAEAVEQTKLMKESVAECVKAVEHYNEIHSKLTIKKAELDLDIRQNPEEYGLAKITESAISAAITVASQELILELAEADSAKYAAILKKEEVLARGAELKNLINLYLNDYYVQTTNTRMAEDANEVTTKQTASKKNKKVTDKIKRVKKLRKSNGE